jgi:FO synthase
MSPLRAAEPSLPPSALADALGAAAEGRGLAREDAVALLDPAAPLAPLLAAAGALRDRGRGRTVTYSRKVFLPLTTLCRDRCGYCAFRRDPGQPGAWYMDPDEVLAVTAEGERRGCTEALFSLGDAPEAVFPEARTRLAALGHRRTLDYLVEMCATVLARSSLFPHSNPGLMGERDLAALRPVNASLGLMLESASARLHEPGGPHHGTRTKQPAARLHVLVMAGRLRIPITTGILIGIGETAGERVDSLLAIRRLHERSGHVQEVILQNFRAKAHIPMCAQPEPSPDDMLRTAAVARLLLGATVNLQAPPNLTEDFGRLLDAGINDWGGVSPVTRDFINPEAPWPQLDRLARETEARGFSLRQRLPVYPEYILDGAWLPAELQDRIRAAVGPDGLVPSGSCAGAQEP